MNISIAINTITRGLMAAGINGNSRAGVPTPSLDLDFINSETLDPRITFSRTTNATRVDSQGLIEYAPHNLLTFSEQFDNAFWSKSQTTVSANTTIAPNGTTTADSLLETATTDFHALTAAVTMALSTTHTFSIYAKPNGRDWLVMNLFTGATSPRTWFNVSTGTIGTVGSGATANITSVGNGWYRCSITVTTASSGTPNIGIWTATADNNFNHAGDITKGLFIWGAQLNVGALQPYYPTTVKNLLGFSEAFNNAYWNKSDSTVTANSVLAPNGTLTATTLTENSLSNAHGIRPDTGVTVTTGQTYTASVYLKANTRTFAQLSLWTGSTYEGVVINLTTGVVTATSGTVASSSVTSVGNGWYRCSITRSLPATPTFFGVWLCRTGTPSFTSAGREAYTGNGTGSIFIWGAQLSDSASLDPYVNNPGAAPSSTAYYGPRFDYDPVTLQPKGLLIEEQRTNLTSWSEDATQWGAGSNMGTTLSNQTTAPDGTVTADKIVENTANSTHFLSQTQTTTYTSGTAYTRSIFLKLAERRYASVYLPGTNFPAAGRTAVFDLQTGTVVSTESGVTSSIVKYPNDWYRCIITAIATSTGSGHVGGTAISDNPTMLSYLGDGTSGIFVWGAQLEAGAFATSYIPTVAAQVTRAADVATITGTNFSGFYNQNEGTLFADAIGVANNISATRRIVEINNGAATERTILGYSAPTNSRLLVQSSSLTQADVVVTVTSVASGVKIAGTYKINDFQQASNATLGTADLLGVVPAVNQMNLGTDALVTSNTILNGTIRKIAYYPTRLSNEQLRNITS